MRKETRTIKRQIDRDYANLLREEERIKQEMKRAAKQGQDTVVHQLAKQVIQLRKQRERLLKTKGHMTALDHRSSVAKSQTTLLDAIKVGASAMTKMNKAVDPAQLSGVMREFATASDMSNMQDDMLDEIFDLEGDEEANEEAENILDEIFGEQALQSLGSARSVPTEDITNVKESDDAAAEDRDVQDESKDLMARLSRLKSL